MRYKKIYKKEVSSVLQSQMEIKSDLITDADLEGLPDLVRKYLYFTGSVGKPKIRNVFIRAKGKIRSGPDDSWMSFISEQYNFFENPARFFYIKARKAGIPASGLHIYRDETASMQIKLAGLFKVVDARGPEMNQGETVTVLNDMCFMAPASLISKRIRWEEIDSQNVKAVFNNGKITVSAVLTFHYDGSLQDFISNDRFETVDGKVYRNYPWRTPVKEYGSFNGYRLPSKADVIYVRPAGEFCYGLFDLTEIRYNCNSPLK